MASRVDSALGEPSRASGISLERRARLGARLTAVERAPRAPPMGEPARTHLRTKIQPAQPLCTRPVDTLCQFAPIDLCVRAVRLPRSCGRPGQHERALIGVLAKLIQLMSRCTKTGGGLARYAMILSATLLSSGRRHQFGHIRPESIRRAPATDENAPPTRPDGRAPN